jgi:FSR family fosmidomycin resistance protein-like MFS transporter
MATTSPHASPADPNATAVGVLVAISLCHLINDMMQSLLPAIYPGLASELSLSFSQIGLVTLVYQITASILQPIIGFAADKRPVPHALPVGTLFSMAGLMVLSVAHVFPLVLLGAALLGMGSSIFHPESSRVARMASGTRHGLAQSVFQVGGNAGQALGPLAAALVVVRWGQSSLAFFALLALLSAAILWNVSRWYKHHGLERLRAGRKRGAVAALPRGVARRGIAVLLALIFSKYIYLASLTSFYTFYLIEKFGVSIAESQFQLFLFLAAVAAGTIAGGPLGDRFGRKYVIWFSILGALPFTLLLPHASMPWNSPLAMLIGFILASAFPAIVVFAQDLMPDNVGTVSGLFFGFAFGVGGIGAAALGWAADHMGIEAVYQMVAFMPVLGLLCVFLPNVERPKADAPLR